MVVQRLPLPPSRTAVLQVVVAFLALAGEQEELAVVEEGQGELHYWKTSAERQPACEKRKTYSSAGS